MTPEGEDADRLWAALAIRPGCGCSTSCSRAARRPPARSPAELPITRQGIAKHLAVLERVDLVQARRTGRETRFTIRDERLSQAQQQMAQVASRWDQRLATIKRIAEATHKASQAPSPRGRT